MRFYLGTHMTGWLDKADVPLCVSYNRLKKRLGPKAALPRARRPWVLDSGAFTVIKNRQRFDRPGVYARNAARFADEVGRLVWCAPQDYMCEPEMLAITKLTIEDHQRLTLHSYLDLMDEGAPVIPILQGWALADYHRHADLYERNGIDLASLPTVGVGSVCKRQNTSIIEAILTSLAGRGYKLHGFGVKKGGFRRYSHALASSDSLAWSFGAVSKPPLPGCTHKSCQNCLRYALAWRDELLSTIPDQQLSLGVSA